jgi:hypothetical protein
MSRSTTRHLLLLALVVVESAIRLPAAFLFLLRAFREVAKSTGKATETCPVDGALNRVEPEYAPFSFRAGAVLSLLSAACILGGWLYTSRGSHD